jgi:hypothetical protein
MGTTVVPENCTAQEYFSQLLLGLLDGPLVDDDAGPSPWLRLSQGAVMIRKLSNEISEWYHLAEQAREWAEEATDPRIRQDYLSVERSWLVRSYDFSESLTRFTRRNRKRA